MELDKKISIAVVRRLPRYYRYLYDLLKMDITRISSKELSVRMGITASQIRQDLNCFGGFGQQGYGYNVETLFNEIGNILGTNDKFKVIIIGAGNMGQALANYENFERRGFKVTGIFDVDKEVIGTTIKGVEIIHMDNLEEFVKKDMPDIAILSVPSDKTLAIAEKVSKLGVIGLWNFSANDLKLPYDVIIENVHLSDSLMVLGYKLKEKRNESNSK
ncbi:MAG: CoA-binding domain protein [Clostridiales bacterium]|jgi:redox-sensing transcriptional repressor|nr:CoA-binding domain protein [Clostridiales bacterium]